MLHILLFVRYKKLITYEIYYRNLVLCGNLPIPEGSSTCRVFVTGVPLEATHVVLYNICPLLLLFQAPMLSWHCH